MSAILIKLVNMSITAGWLVVAVILLRAVLKRAPKGMICVLWALVGIRLICPFSLESAISLIPSVETIPEDFVTSYHPEIDSGIEVIDRLTNSVIEENIDHMTQASVRPMELMMETVSVIWIIGVIGLLMYSLVSVWSLRRKVRVSMPLNDRVFLCDEIDSPFILGVIRPRIYLPTGLSEEEYSCVLAHEKMHLKRKDHWWKPVGFVLLSVYWFNPLMWIAYVLLCRDIEMACDERVIKTMDKQAKKSYSEALLSCSVHRRTIMVCPLAFGEVGVKNRIKSVLNYKRPAFLVIAVALVASVVAGVCFLTNPSSKPRSYVAVDGYTDCEGVDIRIVEMELDGELPYIKAEWTNETGKVIGGGKDFALYREVEGERENCDDGAFFEMIYGYWPKTPFTEKYSLLRFDLSKEGRYILEKEFELVGDGRQYTATVEFVIGPGAGTEGEGQQSNDSETDSVPESVEAETQQSVTKEEPFGEVTTEIAESQAIPFEAQVAWANGTEDWTALYANPFCLLKPSSSSVYRRPIYRVDSKEDLEQFKVKIDEVLNIDMGWENTPSFNEAVAQYGNEFFVKNTLFIIYIWDGSITPQYSITNVTREGSELIVDVLRETQKGEETLVAGWYLLLAVDREDVAGCEEFSIIVNETVKK